LQIAVIRARGNLTKISSCETVTPKGSIPIDVPNGSNFVAFFNRLLRYNRPVWRTVKGGS